MISVVISTRRPSPSRVYVAFCSGFVTSQPKYTTSAAPCKGVFDSNEAYGKPYKTWNSGTKKIVSNITYLHYS